jgi:cobalt-zinc-cadmium efflux system outer membrane protein
MSSVHGGDFTLQQSMVRDLIDKDRIGLDDFLRIAEVLNPEVRAAWNDVGTADGRFRQATLYPNPTLEIEAEDVPARNLGLSHSENMVAVVQPIIPGRRRLAAISAATVERDTRRLAVQHKIREVQSEVRLVYVEVLYIKQAIALQAELLDTAQQTFQIARTRFKARAAPETEIIKTRIDVHELELGRQRLNRLLMVAAERLRSLLGGVDIPIERIEGDLPENNPELDQEHLRTVVRESSPGLLAARKDIEATDRLIDLAEAELIPGIDIRVAYGRNNATDEEIVEAGISLPLPLFNRNQGRIIEARHRADKARRHAESLANTLLLEVTAAYASYMTARDEIATLQDQIVPAAERAFSQAKEGYQAGKTSLLDLLDAQRTLMKARQSRLESLKDQNIAWVHLWKIVGPTIENRSKTKE